MSHTPLPWKWHPKSADREHNGSIYTELRSGHAYAIAMQPRYVSEEQWAFDAAFIVKVVNNHDALIAALADTLRMLQAAHMDSGTDHKGNKRVIAARSALALAKGE